jgi:methyl-accepting chemotaxis protein
MHFWDSLAFRLFSFLLVMAILVFTPMTYIIMSENKENLEYQSFSSACQTNKLIINTTRYSMLKNDRKAIKMTVKSLKKVPEIDIVRIYSKDGISFSTDKDELGEKVDKNAAQCIICHRVDPALEEIPEGEALQIFTAKDGHRFVAKVDPILNSRSCSLTECHPKPSEQKVLGLLETRMSLAEIDKKVTSSRNHMIILLVLTIASIGICSAFFIWFFIHRRVRVLAKGAENVGKGQLDYRVDIWGHDELGTLADNFNEMVSALHNQAERNKSYLENIASAIQVSSGTTSDLLNITMHQSAGTAEQSRIVEEVMTSANEMSATSQKISETSMAVNMIAERTSETCERGTDYLSNTIMNVERIINQVTKVRNHVTELSEQAIKIGGIIEIIEEISEHTELLSLNAAVEAAGAGEMGKRFNVVAEEVGRLANNTLDSTKFVQAIIENIQKTISDTVVSSVKEEEIVSEGIESVKQLIDFFENIMDLVEETRNASAEITTITQQQSSASGEMVLNVQDVVKVTKEVENGINDIENLSEKLKTMSEVLRSLVEEVDQPANDPDYSSEQV